MSRFATVAASLPLVLLAACGSATDEPDAGADPTDSTSPAAAATDAAPSRLPGALKNLPNCQQVWNPGRALPATYNGCIDQAMEMPMAAKGHVCTDGTRLVTFRTRYWAVTGSDVAQVKGDLDADKAYATALALCLAS